MTANTSTTRNLLLSLTTSIITLNTAAEPHVQEQTVQHLYTTTVAIMPLASTTTTAATVYLVFSNRTVENNQFWNSTRYTFCTLRPPHSHPCRLYSHNHYQYKHHNHYKYHKNATLTSSIITTITTQLGAIPNIIISVACTHVTDNQHSTTTFELITTTITTVIK